MNYLKQKWGGIAKVSFDELINHSDYWKEALYDRKMLILKGLHNLSMDQLYDLHLVWGDPWKKDDYATTTEMCVSQSDGKILTEYGNLLTKKSIGNKAMPWHRDIPWHRDKRYPIRSLYPVVMSNGAGDTGTRFCDADIIWERLHNFNFKDLESVQIKIQSWYQVVHKVENPDTIYIPLVEIHPHTKKKSLLLNSFGPIDENLSFSTEKTGTWILDIKIYEKNYGLKLINDLHKAVCTEDNIYNHAWEMGDLVLFDNYSGVFHGRSRVIAKENAERKFWRMNQIGRAHV